VSSARERHLKICRFGVVRPRFQFSTSEQTRATDVASGNFLGDGGVDQNKLGMWSSLWKHPKKGLSIGQILEFVLTAPLLAGTLHHGRGDTCR